MRLPPSSTASHQAPVTRSGPPSKKRVKLSSVPPCATARKLPSIQTPSAVAVRGWAWPPSARTSSIPDFRTLRLRNGVSPRSRCTHCGPAAVSVRWKSTIPSPALSAVRPSIQALDGPVAASAMIWKSPAELAGTCTSSRDQLVPSKWITADSTAGPVAARNSFVLPPSS